MWPFFLICSLIITTSAAKAQVDSLATAKPKKQRQKLTVPKPAGIRIGTDLTHLAFNILSPQVQHYQLNTELLLANKYFWAIEIGQTRVRRTGQSGNFQINVDGQYLTTGLDHNLMYKKSDHDAAYIGLRYGISTLSQAITYTSGDSLWGQSQETVQVDSQQAHWLGAVGGLKVRVASNIYMGARVGLKILIAKPRPEEININDIPGFGTTKSSARLHYNLTASYRIPFGKK